MKNIRKLSILILLFIAAGTRLIAAQGDAETTQAADSSVIIVQDEQPVDTLIVSESQVDTISSSAENGNGNEQVDEEIANLRDLISYTKIFSIIILLIIVYFVNKYLSLILDNLSEKVTNYRLFIKRLAPISRILIWTFAIYLIIVGIISPPFQTIIAIGASVGIAVGFASQDILKNIFGGIMIILDRPFQVGDKIEVGEHYGEVIGIGLRSCRVVTPDDSVVAIPNGELMNKAVSNSNSGALDCQVVAEIFLPATVDIYKAKQIAFKAVYASSYTYLNKPVDVIFLNEVEARKFIVKLRVKAYVIDIRYEFLFISDMTEMIMEECNRLGFLNEEYSKGVSQAEIS